MKRLSSSLHLNSEGEEQPEMVCFFSIKNSSLRIFDYYFQIYPLQIESKTKRSGNLECRVCGAPAHGYNFDQISCESCKAFFRRNALKEMVRITYKSDHIYRCRSCINLIYFKIIF